MTRGAQELNVTHGAISKQIQALEDELGIVLLRRLPRSVEPTAEGAQLAAALETSFGLISAAINQLRPGPLSLSCSASIMMRWLIPRLTNFKTGHPDIDLQVSVGHGSFGMLQESVSVAIRNDVVPPPPDIIVKPLMPEWVGPVCSPEYARQVGLGKAEDLIRARMLYTSSRPDAWHDWFTSVGWEGAVPEQREPYEHFYLVLHAAACGLGVAIAPRYLVEDDLAAGRLTAPFGFQAGRRNVVLWLSPRVRQSDDIRAVADWLKAEADLTCAGWAAGVDASAGP